MSKDVLICGSIAFDTIAVFEGRFRDHILADNIKSLSVTFFAPSLRKEYGGCAGNIAYSLKLLGGSPVPVGTVGQDADDYLQRLRAWKLRTRKRGGSECRQRPSVLLPESCPALQGVHLRRPHPDRGRVSPECCDAMTASCEWYGVPERFRANCAFGGRPMRGAALSHPHRVTARMKHNLKRGGSTIASGLIEAPGPGRRNQGQGIG